MSNLKRGERKNHQGKGGGAISRSALYVKIAKFIPRAIDTLVGLLDSRNEAVRMGAARTLVDKGVPDVKALEIGGEGGDSIKIQVVAYGISDPLLIQSRAPQSASIASIARPPQVSSAELASESTEDNISDKSVNQVG